MSVKMKKSNDPTSVIPMSMANPVRKDLKTWVYLDVMCPWYQTKREVHTVLEKYNDIILPKSLLVADQDTFTHYVQQCLTILAKFKQTDICFDYKWAKIQLPLDISKTVIDVDWCTIVASNIKELTEYTRLIWWWYTWDIHLPNWILKANVECVWNGVFKLSFPGIPYWFHAECERAKRNRIRVELNTEVKAKRFFHEMIAIKRAESESQKPSWKVPANEFLIGNKESVIKWIIKDMSDDWLWFYVSNSLARQYVIWWKYIFVIPYFTPKLSIAVEIKSVRAVHWEHFSEVWWAFDFSNTPADKYEIEGLVGEKNREIADDILLLKDRWDWVQNLI